MNKANNKRSRNTDEAIIRAAFEAMVEGQKPVSKVTVREVCERAGVNRSTFYAHYLDVYDLFQRVEQHMGEMFREQLFSAGNETGRWSFRQAIERVFEFIYQYREFFGFYFMELNRASDILRVLVEPFAEQIDRLKTQKFGGDAEMLYHFTFFTAGMGAIIARWLETGCKETPAQMFEILEREYGPASLFNTWNKNG